LAASDFSNSQKAKTSADDFPALKIPGFYLYRKLQIVAVIGARREMFPYPEEETMPQKSHSGCSTKITKDRQD
jgi:hypothetical protein